MRSIPNTGILSLVENDLNLLVEGTITAIGTGIPTTAGTFAVGAELVDLSTGIQYFNSGSVAVPVWSRQGSSGAIDPQVVQFVTVNLTAAQIITTTTGGVSSANGAICVPAPASGFVNVFHRAIVSFTFGTTAFTGGGNTSINLGGGGGPLTGVVPTATLWQTTGNVVQLFVPLSTASLTLNANAGINLTTTAAVTNPGTASGTCKVYVWYSQVAI